MIDGATIPAPPGYRIERVYLVHCDVCNEEITRPLGGEDLHYATDARWHAMDHDRTFHDGSLSDTPERHSG